MLPFGIYVEFIQVIPYVKEVFFFKWVNARAARFLDWKLWNSLHGDDHTRT